MVTAKPPDTQPKAGSEVDARSGPEEILAKIVVAAGAFDRDHSIVTFPLTHDEPGALLVKSSSGKPIPLERRVDGTATFILDSLGAGQKASFTVERADALAPEGPNVVERDKTVELVSNARSVARFQMQGELPPGIDEVFLRGGYLHPLYTPGGVEVTGDYPHDHKHHHGIWSAWTRTRFGEHEIDFWNMAAKQGKVDFHNLEQTFQGPVLAGFSALLQHIDLLGRAPEVALEERWIVTTYQTHSGAPPYFVIDLESIQKAAHEAPLLLEEYTYGGFALRGNAAWADPARVTFETSEGLDRLGGDNEKGRWCAIGGQVGGATVGFAMLGHPDNFRAPQTFRIHPDHPYMAFAPVKDGPFSIEPGHPYITRFRIVTFDGSIDRELIERLWHDYASPPEVALTAP